MRASHYLFAHLKEVPAEAELISHQLMLRAGMIRKIASGLITWLPMGLRVLKKIENIVRQEMDRSGALEILMPSIQPAELWQETQRWETFGHLLLKITDRNDREFCYGPTHEEVVTDIGRRELRSYKQLPVTLYQIQTKFRDEIRPRFGVMRAREFLMKDAYSFHIDTASLQETYQVMYDTYTRIFQRMGLNFRAVEADSGAIGGNGSHEFQVLADSGEDIVVYSDSSSYAANLEKATTLPPTSPRPAAQLPCKRDTQIPSDLTKSVKCWIVKGEQHPQIALILRADHTLNPVKAEHHPAVFSPLEILSEKLPADLDHIPLIADREAAILADFSSPATEDGLYWHHLNWARDWPEPEIADLRNAQAGDPSPDGQGTLQLARGIEVGHVFQLGDKYSAAMNLKVLNEKSEAVTVQMGCYGIGVSRLVAAAIEQNHDEWGIIWPDPIAPFQIILIPLNYHKSHRVRQYTDQLYADLQRAGYEVLLDDRKERPGVLFASADLIGIPHRVIINENHLDHHQVEYQARRDKGPQLIEIKDIESFLTARLSHLEKF